MLQPDRHNVQNSVQHDTKRSSLLESLKCSKTLK